MVNTIVESSFITQGRVSLILVDSGGREVEVVLNVHHPGRFLRSLSLVDSLRNWDRIVSSSDIIRWEVRTQVW